MIHLVPIRDEDISPWLEEKLKSLKDLIIAPSFSLIEKANTIMRHFTKNGILPEPVIIMPMSVIQFILEDNTLISIISWKAQNEGTEIKVMLSKLVF